MRSWKWAIEQRTSREFLENESGSGGRGAEEKAAEVEDEEEQKDDAPRRGLGGRQRVASSRSLLEAASTAAGRLR